MNQGQNPSRYKVGFSAECGRVAIMDKNTDEVLESFANNVPEELLSQRMLEVREDELLRARLVEGTSLQLADPVNLNPPAHRGIEDLPVEQGGLII
jgi:hypothetical protein